MIGPTDLFHHSPAPYFKTFQVFLIYCPMSPYFSTIQSYAPKGCQSPEDQILNNPATETLKPK